MNLTPITIKYESNKVPGAVYELTLKTLNDMIHAMEDDTNKLIIIKGKLQEALAVIENKLYTISTK